MDRVQMWNVQLAADRVNNGLRPNGCHVEPQQRNGHIGIDLYRGDICLRTLATGLTKRDAYQYLGAMQAALELSAP